LEAQPDNQDEVALDTDHQQSRDESISASRRWPAISEWLAPLADRLCADGINGLQVNNITG
jgi:hypothetical protein